MRGRKPIPTKIKKAKGTAKKCRENKREFVVPAGAPIAPDTLDERAREHWYFVTPPLVEMGVIGTIDLSVLEGYCRAYSSAVRWSNAAQAEPEVEIFGKGPKGKAVYLGTRINPAWSEARKQWALCARFAVELGLTPSARTRVSMDKSKLGPKQDDEEFLSGADDVGQQSDARDFN